MLLTRRECVLGLVAAAVVTAIENAPVDEGWVPLEPARRRHLGACFGGLFPVREGMPPQHLPVDAACLSPDQRTLLARLRERHEVQLVQRVSRVEPLTVERQLGVLLRAVV